MATTKYSKLLVEIPKDKGRIGEENFRFIGAKHFEGAPFFFIWHPLPRTVEPFRMIPEPHAHDFEQYLGFFGGNPMCIEGLGAEVELYLGKEGEKHIITTPQMVHIPKGLIHGPLIFNRVEVPIIFLDIGMAPDYTRAPVK
jgi:hypothetical protein